MKFLLFGTGDYYRRYRKWFGDCEVAALLDNSPEKQRTLLDGKMVLSPEDGIKLEFDVIVILSFSVREMKEQLIRSGVPEQKIYHFYDLHDLFKSRKRREAVCYGGALSEKTGRGKILLLAQELSHGGPQIALYHAAEILKKHGYEVVFASMIDGPLRKPLTEIGIPVVVDENLQISVMSEIPWLQDFSLIICNTINFHVFLTQRNVQTPIIWWLHDAPFFYDGIQKKNLEKIVQENLHVVSAGPIPGAAMRCFLPELSVGELLYGVADFGSKDQSDVCCQRMNLVTIGFLEEIKGQDLLLEAIRLLPDELKKRIRVFLVGCDETLFAQQLKTRYAMENCVQYTGSVDRERLHKILENAELLICPSRQDSMPTVAAEAMMHSVPCLVSDAVGTAAFIRHGTDGLVFPSEDVQALYNMIVWCIGHRREVRGMRKNARLLYERKFSMEIFERSVTELVEHVRERKALCV